MPSSQLAAYIYTTNEAPTVFRVLTHMHAPHMSVSTQRSSAHADARSEGRGARENKRQKTKRDGKRVRRQTDSGVVL